MLTDEGSCFDILSVHQVKVNKFPSLTTKRNYIGTYSDIEAKIGFDKMNLVINSDEYKNLYNLNEKLFETIDRIKIEKTDALVVDFLNHLRYLAKKKLQEKFFGECVFTEEKFGYKK